MEFTLQELKDSVREVIEGIEDKATLTIQECNKYTGIGRDKLMELAHSKESDFPCFRVGNRFLINKEMLIAWLKKVTVEGRVL
ncbi:excisionase [Oceanirhabdus sp. W0125-5]|uniref:excisionase n=1 Tax=Oceanirhabdus sp. W0125-5 TaxID=2999116 RepID=UPI0022F2E2D4|nr:excisionase [Oceanirhabdus sp. W0125-5]WBW98831.1 excisionase [Oceanirhabdus sp. W0125-5]